VCRERARLSFWRRRLEKHPPHGRQANGSSFDPATRLHEITANSLLIIISAC
jgi:hypothetical protein